jgi:hypothetical protein
MDLHARNLEQIPAPLLRRRLQSSVGKFDALAALFGLCLGASAAVHAWDLDGLGVWAWPVVVGCTLLGILLAHLLLNRLVYPGLQRYSQRMRSAWVLLCLLAGFGLVETIPVTIYPKTQVVRIVATGTKNQASQGSEVWLNFIQSGRTAVSAMHTCAGNWKPVESLLMSPSEWQPSVLNCRVRTDQDIDLQFVMHNWSGKARVIYNGQTINEDLYSSGSTAKALTLDVHLSPWEEILRVFLLAAAGITIGFGLLAASLFFAGFSAAPLRYRLSPVTSWLGYGVLMVAVWFTYLLAFWPGFFSPDTLVQFEQVATATFRNDHPAFHTMVIWLLTRIWMSPVPVLIVQMLVLAILLAWCLGVLRNTGVPLWMTWAIALFLAATPATGLILLNPWKDIPYAIALTALTALLLKWSIAVQLAQDTPGPFRSGLVFGGVLGMTAALVALFRQNGVAVAFGTLALLAIIDRRRWKGFGLALAVSLMLYFLITGPFYAVMRVQTKVETSGQNMVPRSLVAYLIRFHKISGSVLTPDEDQLLAELYPADVPIDLEVVVRRWDDVIHTAYSLSLQYPQVTLRYFLNRSSYIFQVVQPPNARVGYVEMAVYPNPYGLEAASKLPGLQTWLTRLAVKSEQVELEWFFWRNAFWMYLLVFSAGVASVRTKNWSLFALTLPILLNALPLALVSGGHIARYIFSTLLLGPVLGIGLLFVRPILPAVQLETKTSLSKVG